MNKVTNHFEVYGLKQCFIETRMNVYSDLYHHNSEIPNNRTDPGSNLNCLMHIQWVNKVERFVLHLQRESERENA
jgi:hypothetical protein